MLGELKGIVGGENFSADGEELVAYSRDFSGFEAMPLCVVRPRSKEQVVGVVKFAKEKGLPLIPRGAGTNTCGEVVGEGIILDMTQMNRILEINEEDFYCVVEPGVVLDDLNKELGKRGFFFPPDPASSRVCTLGGMVANNSSGLRAVKYGTTKDYVLALEVVLPGGEVIKTGSLAAKSSSGYNLTRLFVGSEGTLGVFTRITLRILPMPEHSETIIYGLEDIGAVGEIVDKILAASKPSALEFMDDVCLGSLKRRYGLELDYNVCLIVEFDGKKDYVEKEMKKVKSILSEGISVKDIWEYRKKLVPALINYKENLVPYAVTEDIGVPVSKVGEAFSRIKEIYKRHGFEVAIYGHCGDGNLHMRVLAERDSQERIAKAADDVYGYVLEIGGTITAEHGVGLLRRKYMKKEHGEALKIMKNIKNAIDPWGIMNPGKML
jgi:glycolate oxidase subunit GlcD